MKVVYSRRALRDLERLQDFLLEKHQNAGETALNEIIDAVAVLERHPWIGRPVRGPIRELVISYGQSGYVALYRVSRRQVDVLSVRHQREAGF